MTPSLTDKIILITGAGDGIGRAAAKSFAAAGATCLLLGRTSEKLESLYDEIEAAGQPQPAILPLDLSSQEASDYETLAGLIHQEFGRLDGLLHNAGILGDRASIQSYPADRWFNVMQVNLNAAFLLSKYCLSLLQAAPQASLLFTSSGVGRQGRAYWGAYSASKFATEGLMQILADEMQNTHKVRVNSINPGATRTAMRAAAYPAEDPSSLPGADSLMPLYLYLMSDESLGINGKMFDAQSADPRQPIN